MEIKRNFTKTELERLADFTQRVNSDLEGASMFCSNRREQMLRELTECAEKKILAAADRDGELVGACWMYLDEERCNADVNLLIAPEYHGQYNQLAAELLGELRAALPRETRYTFYFPKQNHACRDFLTRLGARRNVDEYGLLLTRDKAAGILDAAGIEPLAPSDYEEFMLLHDEVFPDVYISGHGIIDSIGKNRTVFVMRENGQITAYSVLETKSENRSCAEIIGVRDGFRHGGRGRKVLSHLIRQAFAKPETRELDLIVDCDNENALKLYFDLGFEVEFENNSFTLPGAV